jgi:KRAB domain-containing zinc finger protein
MDKKHFGQFMPVDEGIKVYTCDLDGKSFKTKNKISCHMKNHLPPVKCDFCHKKIKIRNLKFHIMNSHTGIKQPRTKRIRKFKSIQCPICSKILATKYTLRKHVRDHNQTFKCKYCDKLFGDQTRLKAHIRYYHENTNSFKCEFCSKIFINKYYFKIHVKTHDPNRLKDFKCSQCDYATDMKLSFEGHLKSHKRKDARIAALINPHKCTKCDSVMEGRKGLEIHMYRVHPKALFECDICGKKTKTKQNMFCHLEGFHKIGKMVKS